MSGWHRIAPVANGVWSITEAGHVTVWLIVGSDRALLLDTGMGFVPLRPVIEEITPLPVTVVNTHHHFDHVGGNHEFDDVLIHLAGADHLTAPPPAAELRDYLDQYDRQLQAAASVREIDREFLHLFDADSDPGPLPSGVDGDTWRIRPRAANGSVTDGDELDLGGRALRVLHTPGHTPDGICLIDTKTGILFAGDTVSSGPIYAHEPDSDVDAFTASAARLAELKNDVSLVAMCHFGRVIVAPHLLQAVSDAFESLPESRTRARRTVDAVGAGVDEVPFDRFSILLPAPEHLGH
ncbi:MBL fold metallo-hydrolase [Rhodococcus gannanensis]|uniref:MBL fold metallo-hydrolase n=1 Tax=Rhodococcus gannanensis TaxID=1960308 RepID=A0ABW4P8A9_9NOCA